MSQLLFLQGPPDVNKAALLRRCVSRYKKLAGGYMSLPVPGKAGETVAFRIAPVAEAFLPAGKCRYNNIFLSSGANGWQCNLYPFETVGVDLIGNLGDKRFVVLQPIGGLEMLSLVFREKLYTLLDSGIPCVGVLKTEGSLSLMRSRMPMEEHASIINRKLRFDLINRFSAQILPVEPGRPKEAEQELSRFLRATVEALR